MAEHPLIVVAEDDKEMRNLLGASLRSRGFDVAEYRDGRELLARLESDANEDVRIPSLVVSDLRMPGVSGLDVLHHMRRVLPDVPVILITAFGDDQTHRRAKALGAAAVVDKPFDLRTFHEEVSAALRSGGSSLLETDDKGKTD